MSDNDPHKSTTPKNTDVRVTACAGSPTLTVTASVIPADSFDVEDSDAVQRLRLEGEPEPIYVFQKLFAVLGIL